MSHSTRGTSSDRNINPGVHAEARTRTNKDDVDTIGFQAFLIDQLTKVQEQNENLLSRITRLEKEQEEFYLCGQKKMETGFKNVAKCTEDVAAMKEVFKEIVGIMTGERVKIIDRSQESVGNEEAMRASSSTLLASNSRQETRIRVRQSIADVAALRGFPEFKVEESEDYSTLLHGNSNRRSDLSLVDQERLSPAPGRNTQFEHDNDYDSDASNGDHETNIGNEWVPTNAHTPSGSTGNFLVGNIPSYRMNRAIQSVHDVAREYFEGLPGRPSLMFLERRYGSTWRRSAKERTLFAKRMCIIHKINDIKENPKKYGLPEKVHRNQAIKVVENIRLGNNNFKGHTCRLSISQLYTYFSKKMDTLQDYSLELKARGEPRRNHLMRERMARLEQGSTGETQSTMSTGEFAEPPSVVSHVADD